MTVVSDSHELSASRKQDIECQLTADQCISVSARTMAQARAVVKAIPEIAEAVKAGKISVKKGAAIAKLAKPKQAAALAKALAPKTKPAAPPAKKAAAEQIAEEAYGDMDLLKELEQARAEIEALQKDIAAAQSDDKQAELIKWRRMHALAERGQSEAMDRAHKSAEREKVTKRALMRCGKAVGEDDEFKIPAAVEAMARAQKVGAPHAML